MREGKCEVALLLDQVLRSGSLALLLVTYPWEPADTDVTASRLGGPVFIVSTLIEYSSLLLGGYLAGRCASRRGGSPELMVAGGFLLLTVAVGILSESS